MKFILGKKVGMSQIFVEGDKETKVIPVTLVEADSCYVTQVKNQEKDGYEAVQVAFEESKRVNKPMAGHLQGVGKFFRYLREIRNDNKDNKSQVGEKMEVTVFEAGDKVKVTGIAKAKGFQGAMKRHGFKGGKASHGQKHSNRRVGSIGATYPERVIKGKKMAGRMGGGQITQVGLEIVRVDAEKNLLLIKGCVPGNNGTLLKIVSE
ncbi:MAG: 50S ribosomal protein L3 [Candidatus Pacebacteria bacterium]|jgi:large subunit ribosomal protein L3|nr:50S ribosomal protein L3 [Candidatus Paceibacterota bacterium]